MTAAEALELLRSGTVGRIAFTDRGLPAVQPMKYTVVGDGVIVRTVPGSKLDHALCNTVVAFEIDKIDAARHTGWSVTVVGRSNLVTEPTEIARLTAVGPAPWPEANRTHFIRIGIEIAAGRRVE